MTARVRSALARALVVVAAVAVLARAPRSPAGTVTWATDNSGQWTTPGNWNPAAVPGAADDVVLDRGAADPVITYQLPAAATIHSLLVGEHLDVRGARALTVTGAIQLNDTMTLGDNVTLRGGTVAGSAGGMILIPTGAGASRATLRDTVLDQNSLVRVDAENGGEAGPLWRLAEFRHHRHAERKP